MIGVGTPTARPRRTTLPCSASTSIRLPCDRSMSSDDRVVGGSLLDVLLDALRSDRRADRMPAPGRPAPLRRRRRGRASRQYVVGPDRADRQPRRAGERRKWREVRELLPDRHARVGDGLGVNVGADHRRLDRAHAIGDTDRPATKYSPNTTRRCVPVCRITPGSVDRRGDVRRAADRRVLADNRRDLLGAVDAVLQRQHRGLPGRAAARSAVAPSHCRRS